jgi:hypothetical protein
MFRFRFSLHRPVKKKDSMYEHLPSVNGIIVLVASTCFSPLNKFRDAVLNANCGPGNRNAAKCCFFSLHNTFQR